MRRSGKLLNWFSVNAGYHTAHHNKPGLHWTELPANHLKDVAPTMNPQLLEKSLLMYLARTYVLRFSRPGAEVVEPVRAQEATRQQEAA